MYVCASSRRASSTLAPLPIQRRAGAAGLSELETSSQRAASRVGTKLRVTLERMQNTVKSVSPLADPTHPFPRARRASSPFPPELQLHGQEFKFYLFVPYFKPTRNAVSHDRIAYAGTLTMVKTCFVLELRLTAKQLRSPLPWPRVESTRRIQCTSILGFPSHFAFQQKMARSADHPNN